jgi:hypothetical protein
VSITFAFFGKCSSTVVAVAGAWPFIGTVKTASRSEVVLVLGWHISFFLLDGCDIMDMDEDECSSLAVSTLSSSAAHSYLLFMHC